MAGEGEAQGGIVCMLASGVLKDGPGLQKLREFDAVPAPLMTEVDDNVKMSYTRGSRRS